GTGQTAITDDQGALCVDGPGCDPITLTGTLSGLYADVLDDAGPEIQIDTGPIADGESISIAVNEVPTDEDTAEVNAYLHVNRAHDWFSGLPLVPPFTDLDFPLQVRVNRQLFGTCNAAYDPSVPELFFLPEGGLCPNSAFSSVIYHEYTHAIVWEIFGGFPDFNLNEGLADAGAIFLTGHRLVGRDFYGPGAHLRDIEVDLVHPVVGDIWTQGRVVGGSFFDLRTRCIHELGVEAGTALAETLYAKSLYFMPSSIGDGVVTAVLLADDDDGDLSNGTPHASWILESFQIHGLQDQFAALAPIAALTDQVGPGLVAFDWLLPLFYDEIIVERDGAEIAVLPGTATSFLDSDVGPGLHTYLITGRVGALASPGTPRLVHQDRFLRGDADADGVVAFGDVFELLDHRFGSGAPLACPDAADVDDDGSVGLSDAVMLLEYLFVDGPPPAGPFPLEDEDDTTDYLPCAGEL
ncbi:MAG: hypothetical protein KDC38_12945, partial [Planctomycetes bacterium]|nr:hypothetical protein [Planctomycetota bacterium]